MSGTAGMSASSRRELYKKLRKYPRNLMDLARRMPISQDHPFTHLDGLVSAVHPDIEFFVSSPNMEYIPFPHLGDTKVISARDDLRFGHLDPTQWPQDWSVDHPHLACIPRIQKTGVLCGLWATPNIEHDFEVDCTLGQGFGRLHKEFMGQVLASVQATKDSAADSLDPQKVVLAATLEIHIDHFTHVLRTRGIAFRRTLLVLRCLQRVSLELQGLSNYYRDVVPRWNDIGGNVRSVNSSWIGAFTDTPVIMAHLFRAGIPVWSIWFISEVVRTRCFGVVEFQRPESSLELGEAREPNLRRVLYSGASTCNAYTAIRTWTFGRAASLANSHYVSTLSSRPTGALPAPSTISRTLNAGRKAKKQPGKPRMFKQAYHKYLPTPVKAWICGLEQVEDNDALCLDPNVLLVFSLPRPDLFVSAASDDKLKAIFVNWLRIRGVVYSLIHDPDRLSPSDWHQMSHQAWRLLIHNGTLDITLPKPGSRETRFADEVLGLVQAIRRDDRSLGGVSLSFTPTWHGVPFLWSPANENHEALCREIVWECATMGFVLDLMMLDSRLASWSDDKQHQSALRLCFRTTEARSLVDVDLGMANTGLADPDWTMRAPYLSALKVVVCHWVLRPPHHPLPDTVVEAFPHIGYSEQDFIALEEAVAKVVVQTFYTEFRRPLVLPPTLPEPGADPAHIDFQPPDVPRSYAATGFSQNWTPSAMLRMLEQSPQM